MTTILDSIRADLEKRVDAAQERVEAAVYERDMAVSVLSGFDTASDAMPVTLPAAVAPVRTSRKRNSVQRAVMALFTETLPRWTEDALVEHTGFPLASVRRVLKRLVDAGKLRVEGGVYSLPPRLPTADQGEGGDLGEAGDA